MCSKNISRDEYLLVAVILLVYHEIKYMRLIQGLCSKDSNYKIKYSQLSSSRLGMDLDKRFGNLSCHIIEQESIPCNLDFPTLTLSSVLQNSNIDI